MNFISRVAFVFCFVAFFVFTICPYVFSQSAHLENGVNGTGVTIKAVWEPGKLAGVGFHTGYSLSGIMDLGMGLDLFFDEIQGTNTREVNGYIFYNVFVFKQQQWIPVSLQVVGSYGLNHISGEYFDDNGLIKRGTGFTIGAVLSRNFTILPALEVMVGLSTSYRSYRFSTVTEQPPEEIPEPPVEPPVEEVPEIRYPLAEEESNFYYGCLLGISLLPARGPVFSVSVAALLDLDAKFHLEPELSVAVPVSYQ